MEKTKTTEVFITALRIAVEDDWLKEWTEKIGFGVSTSPQYLYLKGKPDAMMEWMNYRKLPSFHLTKPLMDTLKSILRVGQLEPIKIYKDMRIATGHKRAACLLFLGKDKIKAEFVEDDYKL